MSALAVDRNSFSAHLALPAGVAVSITASTLTDLQAVVAKLQPAANDAPAAAAKPAAAPKPTPAPAAAPAAGNAPASTPAPAGAQPAASGSAAAGDEAKRPTYDDVRDRVLKLAKVSRDSATAALAKFSVDHANKLKLEDYPAFLAHADQVLAGGASA
ncbi:MAG: hypothetical protein JWQ72_1605, partial [Polaromonas sp.]|nr:hypothetical protein [Polaromonas sp.]